MTSVKVHEWCLVCYGWLVICLSSTFYAFIPLQLCYKTSFVLSMWWVSCVAYLIDGIVWLYQRPFRDASLAALNEPRNGLCGPCILCACIDGMALGASFGLLDTEPHVGCSLFIDAAFALVERSRFSKRPTIMHWHACAWWAVSKRNATWLILPVVICLSQRLSHACVSMNKFRL